MWSAARGTTWSRQSARRVSRRRWVEAFSDAPPSSTETLSTSAAARIRFSGIDAPESRQSCRDRIGSQYACGRRAAFALSDKIGSQNISCEVLDHDRYGRLVATCSLGSLDLNGWMVSSGWALAYRQYSTAYVGAEEQAEAAKAGIWAGRIHVAMGLAQEPR